MNPFYKLLENFDKLEEDMPTKVKKIGNQVEVTDGKGNKTMYDEKTWEEMNQDGAMNESFGEQIGGWSDPVAEDEEWFSLTSDEDENLGDDFVEPFIDDELEEAGFEDDEMGFISQPQFKQDGRTPGEQMRDGYDDEDVDTGGWDGANDGDDFEPELEEAEFETDNDFDAGMDSGYSGDLDANYQAGDDEFDDFEPELDADELTKNDEADYVEFDLKKHGKRLRPGTPVILDDEIGGGQGVFIEKSPSGAFGTVERNGKTISIHLNDIDQADLTHSSVYESFDKQFNKLMEEITVTRTSNADTPENDTITITGTEEHAGMLTDMMKLAGMEGGDGVELPQDAEIPVNIDPSMNMMPRGAIDGTMDGAIDDAPPMGMEMGDMMGMMDDVNEEMDSLEEGLGDSMKKGAKWFKRGMQGWDNDAGYPDEMATDHSNYSDDMLNKFTNDSDDIQPHSPAGLQQKLISREKRRRDSRKMTDDVNVEEDYSNEPDERYSDVETQVNGMSGGLNKRKKMFKKGYPGNNDMTVDLEEGKAKQEKYTVYNKKTNTIVKPNLTKHEAEKLVAKDGDNAMGSPSWVADRVNKTTNESKQSFLNLYHKIADLDK